MNSANNTNGNDSGRSAAPISRRVWIILAVLCTANIIAHLALFGRLPEQVPTHWGADGSVNGYGPRAMTLILDILPLVLLGLFRIIPGMDPKGESYGKAGGLYRGFVIAFTLIMCGMTWLTEITAFGLIPTKGGPVGLIVSAALGALFIGLIIWGLLQKFRVQFALKNGLARMLNGQMPMKPTEDPAERVAEMRRALSEAMDSAEGPIDRSPLSAGTILVLAAGVRKANIKSALRVSRALN